MNMGHFNQVFESAILNVGRSGEVSADLIRQIGLGDELDRLADMRIADARVIELEPREIVAAILAARMVRDAIRRATPKSAAGG